MELFRAWGIHDEIIDASYPYEHLPFRRLADLGGVTPEERLALSPTTVTSCAQDVVEDALLGLVAELDSVDVSWNVTCNEVCDRGDAVELSLQLAEGTTTATARFCLAADGASSSIRASLGIGMVGDDSLGTLLNVYFTGHLFPGHDPQPLGHRFPEGSFISMDGDRRGCFHIPYDADVERPEDYDDARCKAIIEAAAGPTVEIDVRSVRPWRMTALVAERFRSGRVFLVGDAAHAFPPTGGLGLNSGVQDAHNLAWKISTVLDDRGSEMLLASYELERQPVAFLNTAQSLRNARFGDPTKEFPAVLPELDARANRTVRSMIGETTDAEHEFRVEVLEHSAAIGQELGVAYDGSPVVVDDGVRRPDVQIAKYVPNACPGARAPHLWLDGDHVTSLLDHFGTRFVLLAAPGGQCWIDALASLDQPGVEALLVASAGDVQVAAGPDFCATYGLTDTGVVLVRPDGFVAFRADAASGDLEATLRNALAVAQGRDVAGDGA